MNARALLLFTFFFVFSMQAGAQANTRSYSYAYDYWEYAAEAVPAFVLERVIDRSFFAGFNVGSFDDVCFGAGKLFFIDSTESRLHILNENLEFIASIRIMVNSDNRIALDEMNEQIELTNPEGVFYHDQSNEIFIADTGARRILVLDGDEFFLKRVISRPDNMTGVTEFEPSKIIVDHADRIYVVVQSGFEGIIELNADGSFSRYFGVNRPKVNLLEHFWRAFATNEQRARMARVFAPAFNNIEIDADGFIYTTSFDANSRYTVFRLNPRGENVLIQTEKHPVVGDFSPDINNQFTAIAVNDYGVYAVLDRGTARIFIYNFFGEIISIINYPSGVKGSFTAPSGITWFGDKLIATDRQLRRAYIYTMTDFGRFAMGAARHYHSGQWEESAELLKEALLLNSNFDLAYSGIGKYFLMQNDYENAMYYLKLGQDRKFYSMAYNHFRNQWIQDNFFWFALIFILIVGAVIYTEIKSQKRKKE